MRSHDRLLRRSLGDRWIGGVCGVLLARWMLDGLAAILPAEIPAFMGLRLDGAVLLFTLAATTLSARGRSPGPQVTSGVSPRSRRWRASAP